MPRPLALAALAALAFSAAACRTTGGPAAPSVPTTDADLAAATRGDHAFAAKLYANVRVQEGNLFFAPSSVRTALAMAYAGARGETASEMATALDLRAEPAETNRAMAAMLKQLAADDGGQKLRVVNRLWGQEDRAFQPEFLGALSTYYAAPLERVDFKSDPEAGRARVNRFVEDATEHKIVDLLKEGTVSRRTKLVITNAVYFKADWDSKFEAESTMPGQFFSSASRTVDARFMSQENEYAYAETADAQVLEMPYLSGRTAMVLAVPKQKDGLAHLEAELDGAAIDKLLAALKRQRVSLSLPKFKATSSFELAPALEAMGMKKAFEEGGADFSGIDGTRELFVSAVVHKAYVDVDEKGTEAAAATAVMAKGAGAPAPSQSITVRADHPFLFFIRDTKTGAILFMGRLTDPTK